MKMNGILDFSCPSEEYGEKTSINVANLILKNHAIAALFAQNTFDEYCNIAKNKIMQTGLNFEDFSITSDSVSKLLDLSCWEKSLHNPKAKVPDFVMEWKSPDRTKYVFRITLEDENDPNISDVSSFHMETSMTKVTYDGGECLLFDFWTKSWVKATVDDENAYITNFKTYDLIPGYMDEIFQAERDRIDEGSTADWMDDTKLAQAVFLNGYGLMRKDMFDNMLEKNNLLLEYYATHELACRFVTMRDNKNACIAVLSPLWDGGYGYKVGHGSGICQIGDKLELCMFYKCGYIEEMGDNVYDGVYLMHSDSLTLKKGYNVFRIKPVQPIENVSEIPSYFSSISSSYDDLLDAYDEDIRDDIMESAMVEIPLSRTAYGIVEHAHAENKKCTLHLCFTDNRENQNMTPEESEMLDNALMEVFIPFNEN